MFIKMILVLGCSKRSVYGGVLVGEGIWKRGFYREEGEVVGKVILRRVG